MVLPSWLWAALGARTSLHEAIYSIYSSGGFSIPKVTQATLAGTAGSQQEMLAVLLSPGTRWGKADRMGRAGPGFQWVV